MISQLQTIYPSLLLLNPDECAHPENYYWFQTEENESIAILKEEVDDKDNKLLSLFLSPIHLDYLWGTERERTWYYYVKGKSDVYPEKRPLHYRFVFFHISELPIQKESFHEAFQSLFPERMPIFFEDDHNGFIIEEFLSPDQESISFHEMIDVIMSDFYTKIRFYISDISSSIEEAPELFEWASYNMAIAAKYRVSHVASHKDTLPYVYIDALPASHKKQIQRRMVQQVGDESDLLHTIKVFLESGSNATLAAKRLYMHRNSLQYRVDKFIEKTGFDVKRFDEAMMIYLALLQLEDRQAE
ncbi:PucR family transcriptional regulator [Halobacillus salinus]|uniref:PucR family transcriptional regulator n=1 Tax=Halobacillus salinus TaxID=192814 RepID=UPI0009A658CE|nr:helix-turn-helix domain-containing protein [Halobacillus salinus]